jgi:hypothetical protein
LNRAWWPATGLAITCIAWFAPSFGAEPLAGLLACREVSDSTARLACFDRETANLDLKSVTSVPAPVHLPPPPDPKKQFGLPEQAVATQEVAAGTRAADAPNIEAHITQLSFGENGRIVFSLDNDQVWRQLISNGDLLVKPGDAVTISRAALGSYWLQTKTGRGCKVKRVR